MEFHQLILQGLCNSWLTRANAIGQTLSGVVVVVVIVVVVVSYIVFVVTDGSKQDDDEKDEKLNHFVQSVDTQDSVLMIALGGVFC